MLKEMVDRYNNTIKFILLYLLTCTCMIIYINFASKILSQECKLVLSLQGNYIFQVFVLYALFYIIIFYLQKKIKKVNLIFYALVFFFSFSTAYLSYLTYGEALKGVLFFDSDDTFMDYFNCISLGDNPYMSSEIAIYPPLSMIIFSILGRMSGIGGVFSWHEIAINARSSQIGITIFGLYLIVLYSVLLYLWVYLKQGNFYEKVCFTLSMLLSFPFIFMFERGNNILLSLIFLTCFIHFYKIPVTKIQLVSYVCLIFAISIKLSPAIFLLLLLREKRYKAFLVVSLIGVAAFFLPFALYDGNPYKNFIAMLKNIEFISAYYTTFPYSNYVLDVKHFLSLFFPQSFSKVIKWIIVLLGVWGVIGCKKFKEWEVFTILSCLLIIIPSFSTIYSLVYMSIPLMFFLDYVKFKNAKYEKLFVILFAGIFVVIPNLFNTFVLNHWIIGCVCILELLIFIEFKGIVSMFLNK